MRVQELKNTGALKVDEIAVKLVTVFLESVFYKLDGNWDWEMETGAVLCSDVILSMPGFAGTKAIFHPDDVEKIKAAIKETGSLDQLRFRIITTYGKVKLLSGRNIVIEKIEDETCLLPQQEAQAVFAEMANKAEQQHLRLLQQIHLNTERFNSAGLWYYNTVTNHTWYSDFVFRLHGLPPQSLNAHLHTFHPFIRPEDIDTATEFIEKAYVAKAPLHLEYRIITPDGEKTLLYQSSWMFSEKGEEILYGTLKDVTQQKLAEAELQTYKDLVQFQKQQLAFDEQQGAIGHWQIDLLTRKIIYSDNYYRIFGLKPGAFPATISSFINYVHPDDQETVTAAYKKLIYEHTVPDLEYRIVRSDGKTRHIRQKARLMMHENDIIVFGIIEDITVQRLLEKKVAELNDQSAQVTLEQLQLHELAGTGSWMMDIENETITWSESFYKLLGYKASIAAMSQKTMFSFIHPHDVKMVKEQWNLTLKEKQSTVFHFRFLLKGAERHMKAIFRIHQHKDKEVFIGTVQDVTLENVLEQQLANRMQLAESLTEHIPDRVMITDINHTILLWNKACEKIYGMYSEAVLGQNFFDVFPHLKTERESQLLHKALKGEKVVLRGEHSNTGNGYYDLYLMPLYRGEEITGILHIIHDTTKETELRNNLHERLNFIESLLESSVDRIIALDRNLNYIYWNNKAEQYYGLSKNKVIGKNVLEIFPQIRNDPSFGEYRQALRGETVHIPANHAEGKYFETYLLPIKEEKGDVSGILWIAHDLTRELQLMQQQRQVQEQLNNEHQRLKEVLGELELQNRIYGYAEGIANMGTWTWDPETDESHFSDNMFRLFGMSDQEVTPDFTTIPQYIHPDDRSRMLNMAADLKEGMGSMSAEYRVIRKDGVERIFRNQLNTVVNEEGKRIFVGTTTDITETKKAEDEMRKNMAILQDAELLAQMGSWEYDLASETFKWSEGMYRLFEIPGHMNVRPEIYLDFAVEQDRSVAKAIIKKIKKTPQPFEEKICIKREDGVRCLQIKASVVPNAKGEPQKLIGVDMDITDIKEAEEKLAQSQHWLQQTAKASPDAITIYDLQKKQPVYLNNCLAEWTGLSLDELIEMGIEGRLKLIHPDDRLPLLHFNEKMALAADGEMLTIEYRLKREEGTVVWVLNRSKVFQRNSEGKVTHILSILQDITKAKEAENILHELNISLDKKNKDLESKNEEITAFAFVASHDLKEPLRKLNTFTDWLLTRECSISDAGKISLRKMQGSIKRLDVLIDDIMSLSQAHLVSSEKKKIDLNVLLRKVEEALSDEIEKTGAQIEAARLPSIMGDEGLLFSLFENLVTNSIKFQPPGNIPNIRITAEEITTTGKKGIQVSFTDNGIGFTQAYARKIFLIFQRLHGRDEYEGTGMGLAICKKIMEKHGGTINAVSEPGKGATFTCWFPL